MHVLKFKAVVTTEPEKNLDFMFKKIVDHSGTKT